MSQMIFNMKAVAQRTGLSPHVIRVWEKRYGAVQPARTESNRRHYSEAELERLSLLKAATVAGHSIGQIAQLSDAQLRELAQANAAMAKSEVPANPATDFVARARAAIDELDSAALDKLLGEAAVELGSKGLLERVVAPLTSKVGELWASGDITAAQEHFTSSIIRSFLGNHARPYAAGEGAPVIVVGTPAGQLHELGAAMVAAAASSVGWKVVNLGPGLPAAELAGAVVKSGARVVALSIVYPVDDPRLPDELERLRVMLPDGIEILVGGRAAGGYAESLEAIGARTCGDLPTLYRELEQLRAPEPV